MKVFIINGYRTFTRREPIAETCSNYATKSTCLAAGQTRIKTNLEGVGYGG